MTTNWTPTEAEVEALRKAWCEAYDVSNYGAESIAADEAEEAAYGAYTAASADRKAHEATR
jgi:hypothetical protein